jgi:membrane protease YdiL (CAAX protease family)
MSSPAPARIVRLSVLFYLPMVLSGYFIRPPGTLGGWDGASLALGLLAALALGGLVVLASRLAAHRTDWGRALHRELAGVLGGLASSQIMVLSLLSAFGEEILFRGVLHPRLGLIGAALLFALLHFPARRALLPWSAFALVLGLVLGGLTDLFQSLWPAILLHFLINYFNLHDLAQPLPPRQAEPPAEPMPPEKTAPPEGAEPPDPPKPPAGAGDTGDAGDANAGDGR